MLAVLVDQHRLAIDGNFQRGLRHADHQGYPAVDRHGAGHVLNRLEILPVSAKPQVSGGVQGDFVAIEMIRSDARVAQLDNQPRVAGRGIG